MVGRSLENASQMLLTPGRRNLSIQHLSTKLRAIPSDVARRKEGQESLVWSCRLVEQSFLRQSLV